MDAGVRVGVRADELGPDTLCIPDETLDRDRGENPLLQEVAQLPPGYVAEGQRQVRDGRIAVVPLSARRRRKRARPPSRRPSPRLGRRVAEGGLERADPVSVGMAEIPNVSPGIPDVMLRRWRKVMRSFRGSVSG